MSPLWVRVLRVGERPDIRDPERPEELSRLGKGYSNAMDTGRMSATGALTESRSGDFAFS